MNLPSPISYEDQAKARARQRHIQVFGKPKIVNLVRYSPVVEPAPVAQQSPRQPRVTRALLPTAQQLKNEPRHHMEAWKAYLDALRDISPARRFVKMQCFHHGVTYKEVCSRRRLRYLSLARELIIIATHDAFPDLSSPQLGRLINKDHTSVLKYLGRLKCKSAAGKRWREKQARMG